MFTIHLGLPRPLADEIIAITLDPVAVSIVPYGISVTPLVNHYAKRKLLRSKRASPNKPPS